MNFVQSGFELGQTWSKKSDSQFLPETFQTLRPSNSKFREVTINIYIKSWPDASVLVGLPRCDFAGFFFSFGMPETPDDHERLQHCEPDKICGLKRSDRGQRCWTNTLLVLGSVFFSEIQAYCLRHPLYSNRRCF